MKKVIPLLLAALLLMLTACSVPVSNAEENSYSIYYLNMEVTGISAESYQPEAGLDSLGLAEALLTQLETEPESAELRRTLSHELQVQNVSVDGYLVTVDFPAAYGELAPVEEVLIRAAVVKTLCQIDGIVYVSFTIDGEPLIGADGTAVGKMSDEDFVENPEEQINTVEETTLTLYFADAQGTSLIPVYRTLNYSSNTSPEKLVMEQLIAGTTIEGTQNTLPDGTRLVSISVMDGVCYVNLDETFVNNMNPDLPAEIILYSIVNSLTELDEVDSVQISVNGDTSGQIGYKYDMSAFYKANPDLIRKNGSVSETESVTEEAALPSASNDASLEAPAAE